MWIQAMLVDDEPHILRHLQDVMPWNEWGIEVTAVATNGREAWRCFQAYRPQLILCDIRMPVMDGIELIRNIRRTGADSEVILLTGYKDFEYTQKAIRCGVKDYLLKPLDYDELADTVQKTAEDIRTRCLRSLKAKKYWQHIRKIADEKMLHDVLLGYHDALQGVDGEASYRMLVADVDDYSQHAIQWGRRERNVWNFSVKNVISDNLQKNGEHCTVLQMREGEWVILLQAFDGLSLRSLAQSIHEAVRQFLHLQLSIGFWEGSVSCEALLAAYKQIQRQLHFSKERGEKAVFGIDGRSKQTGDHSLWDAVETIVAGLKQANSTEMRWGLEAFHQALDGIAKQSLVRVEQILHYVILHLLRELTDMHVLQPEREKEMWNQLEYCVSIKELMQSVEALLEESFNRIGREKNSDVMMMAAKDYIDRHLQRDLGLEEIADYLQISPSYFSVLFKQRYGETFLAYVTRKRMEKARTLILATDWSVRRIGEEVGYPERRYFTKVFQKYFGTNPSSFRQVIEKEKQG